MSDEMALHSSPSIRNEDLHSQSVSHVGTLRQVFDWNQIERSEGAYDLEDYDALVAGAAQYGIRVLPVLFNPPRFRSSRPKHHAHRGVYPPKRNASMAAFATALVRRYGRNGTLWSDHPELPKVPIYSWQIWNEPNIPIYWASGPSAKRYTKLLRVVGGAIEKADPKADIVTAGMPQSNLGIRFERFVAGIYRAGGKSAFDTLGLHAYARGSGGTIQAARLARKIMNRHHDRRGKVWVTEVGWSSGGPASTFRAGRKGQAKRVRGLLLGLAKRRRSLGLRGVIYYKWRDTRLHHGDHDYFGLHTGLLSAGGKAKPAFYTFRRVARRLTL